MTVEAIRFPSADGTSLEGEIAAVDTPRGGVVLCHPHPQYGGSMRAGLVGDLFRELPGHGFATLRFNFRGVEGSEGGWDAGRAERQDAAAAVDSLAGVLAPSLPLVLAGWSFGADMALSVHHPRLAAWCAVASPMRFADALDVIGADPRPKLVILGAHDEVVSATRVRDVVATWRHVSVTVISGATHFFVGRTDAVVDAVVRFLGDVAR